MEKEQGSLLAGKSVRMELEKVKYILNLMNLPNVINLRRKSVL